MAILCVYHPINISTDLIMLLQPFANMSFKLHPLAVGWDTSKNIQQVVVLELLFHTALQMI